MKKILRLAALLAILAAAIPALAASPGAALGPRGEQWVDSVFRALSPRQRVAQLFIPHLVIKDNQAGRDLIRKYVAGDGVGGLLLGSADIAAYASLNSYAFSLAKVPLMITADAEWGLSMRLKDAPRFPHNIALGATADTAAIAAYGREMARECRQLGITVSFAPVADVNSNPKNPVIGFRSFGEDPQRVAALSVAYARGLEQGGVMAVGKHFPGHGDTSTDSHKTLPTVNRSAEELGSVELVPFRSLVKAGTQGMMVGHIRMPALDGTGTPASLSRNITTGLLKERLGFEGLVFTDALEMAGAQVKGANNCVLALKAGADVLLGSASPSTDIDAVMKAIKSGKLSQVKVDEAVRKVLAYKYRLGLTTAPKISAAAASSAINSAEARAINDRLAAASVTVVRNSADLLPLKPDAKVIIYNIGGNDPLPTANAIAGADAVIATVTGATAASVRQFSEIAAAAGSKLVAVMMMNPYKMAEFASPLKQCATLVMTGDNTPALREAAMNVVMGRAGASGRMPVNVKGVAALGEGVEIAAPCKGHDSEMAATIDSLIDRGLAEGAFTGCQVLVEKDGRIAFSRSAGTIDGRGSARVTDATLFDLASVSKVAGTLLGLMAAYDRGLFRLDDTLDRFMPELSGLPAGSITMRSLMLHESGLPAGIKLSAAVTDADSLRTDLYSREPSEGFPLPVARGIYASEAAYDSIMARITAIEPNPSRGYCYSDLNFILLMEAEQRITGRSHDEWVDETIYEPMGIERLTYRPLDLFDESEIAATERDNRLRRQKVHGYVHDETAAFMGGLAGNAGLFGNSEALAAICNMLSNGGTFRGHRILSEATVKKFLSERGTGGRRGLGFDTSTSRRFLGHTGFTGTCFWFDPERKLTVVVLTNRVNPSRENPAWNRLNFRNSILNAADAAFCRQGSGM